MSKFRIPKINSIHFGAAWILLSLFVGLLLPAVIRIITGIFYWKMSIIGGVILLGFIVNVLVIAFVKGHFIGTRKANIITSIVYVLSKVFGQGLTGRLSQVIIICGPFIVFTILFSKIPMIPIALKIIIPIVYFCVVTPYIAFIEDDWATENIFELATEWDFF